MLRNVNVPKGEIFLPLPRRPPAAPPNLEQILDNILMDFIKGLPHSKGADTILVVVDHLSKYAYFVPFIVFSQHRRPMPHGLHCQDTRFLQSIISNQDKIFASHFLGCLFKHQGTQLK